MLQLILTVLVYTSTVSTCFFKTPWLVWGRRRSPPRNYSHIIVRREVDAVIVKTDEDLCVLVQGCWKEFEERLN